MHDIQNRINTKYLDSLRPNNISPKIRISPWYKAIDVSIN